jgi:hypothetical protein
MLIIAYEKQNYGNGLKTHYPYIPSHSVPGMILKIQIMIEQIIPVVNDNKKTITYAS